MSQNTPPTLMAPGETMYFRNVLYEDIERMEGEGWENEGPLPGHHARWGVLMSRAVE